MVRLIYLMKKLILKILIILTFFSISYAEEKKYDQKTCEEIYVGIAYFLKQRQTLERNEE